MTTPAPNPQYALSTEEFTFKSLWDDYDRRTWHYDYAKTTLGQSAPRLLNWIGSIDQSGYTREKCLRVLIANREPGDENRILLRLADWVPQVQVLARDWILSHFCSLPLDAISANQSLILYLSRKDRLRDDAGMHEIIRNLLARSRAMTPSQFFGFTPVFRRFLFSLSLEDDEFLRPLILHDPEPFNRLLLLCKVHFSELTGDEQHRLRVDKSVFVRRRLFHAQFDAGISPDRDELTSLALSANRSLREMGQFYLKKNYGEEAYTIYKGLDGEAFFFIADYARKEDVEHFFDGVRSGSRSTQYNCLRALASTAPERLKELDIPSLIPQSRKFRSVLLPLLSGLLSLEDLLALRSAFETSSPHGKISWLRILARKSFWAFVDEGLAVLLTDSDPALRQTVIRTIEDKASICESLSPKRHDTIRTKISRLRAHDGNRYGRIADLLEFTIRKA